MHIQSGYMLFVLTHFQRVLLLNTLELFSHSLESDNAACFTGEEFQVLMTSNGIKNNTLAPHHPPSNSHGKCTVQIVKNALKKVTEVTINIRLAKIIFAYHITPQSTTGVSLSELLLTRRPHCRLDLVKPNIQWRVENK